MVFRRRRLVARKTRRYVRRRYVAIRVPRLRPPLSLGKLLIRRKIPMFALQASPSIPGVVTTNNPTTLILGSPTPSQTGAVNVYDVPFAMEFHLSDLASVSDITNIADKYKILKASVKLLSVNFNYVLGNVQPYIQWVDDEDDASAPTVTQLEEKMGLRTRTFARSGSCFIGVKPKVATRTYNGTLGFTAYQVGRGYLNTAYPNVPHYGLKGVVRNVQLNGTGDICPALS